MPKLQNVNVIVTPSQAQYFLNLASLRTLTLNIIGFSKHDPFLLELCASSQLRILKIVSIYTTKNMTLLVNNTNVQYSTVGIHTVATTLASNVDLDGDAFMGI